MKRILSIDGGGIRGIVPGQILVNLEQKIQRVSGDLNARLADYFDFFAGTSTGGILTCIYLFPGKAGHRAKFSAEEAVDLYRKKGTEIFHIPFWKTIESLWGLNDEKYDVSFLEKQLDHYFGEHSIGELLKPCLIPAYNIEERSAKFLTQHDVPLKGASHDFKVKDVARATSAAPTYFEPARIFSKSGVEYTLVDGGVFANDPTMCAYSEVRKSNGSPTAADMLIVSLGTGTANKRYEFEQMKNSGAVGWIKPIIDIMMSGSSETTKYHMNNIFDAARKSVAGMKGEYLRIEPTSFKRAKSDMADASEENIAALRDLGQYTAEKFNDTLDHIAELVVQNGPDPVVFSKVGLLS